MEVFIEEQVSRNEDQNAAQHVYVNINIHGNASDNVNVASASNYEENNKKSKEQTLMLRIRDRIARFKFFYNGRNSEDIRKLLTEMIGIYKELNNRKTIVECLISENSNTNVDVGLAMLLHDIEDEISNIYNIIEDVCSKLDHYVDVHNTTQLSITIEEHREKVANFVRKIEEIQGKSIAVQSSEQTALLNAGKETVTVEQTSEQQVDKELLCYGKMLWFITYLTKQESDGFSKLSRVEMYCALLIAIIFSAFDVGTDMWLMAQYFLSEQYLYGTLTMIFVWGPALFTTYWLYLMGDYTWLYQFQKKKWLLIILYIVPIASAVVAFNIFILFWKNKIHILESLEKTMNLLELQLADSYMESLPQLTLQLSVILNNVEKETQDTNFLNMLRWVSMSFSVFTVARVSHTFTRRNKGVQETGTLFICTLLLIGSRVLVLSMGFVVSPPVAGVCLLLHWSIVAVDYYRRHREEQLIIKRINSIHRSVVDATMYIFYYNWYFPNPVVYCKVTRLMFLHAMYTLQCVVFTTLWCVYSSTRGTVWYYAIPAVAVLLYITVVLLQIHFHYKRSVARRQRLLV